MKAKSYLLRLDKTLVKSWICVLPLESLAEFIGDFSSDLLLILQGVSYRVENTDHLWTTSQVCLSVAFPS